jgi:hypothetical protein
VTDRPGLRIVEVPGSARRVGPVRGEFALVPRDLLEKANIILASLHLVQLEEGLLPDPAVEPEIRCRWCLRAWPKYGEPRHSEGCMVGRAGRMQAALTQLCAQADTIDAVHIEQDGELLTHQEAARRWLAQFPFSLACEIVAAPLAAPQDAGAATEGAAR